MDQCVLLHHFFFSLSFFSVVVLLFPNSNMIAAYSFSQLLRLLWCGSRAASFYRVAPRGVIDSRPRSIDYDYLKVRRCVIYRTGAAKIGAPRGSEEQQWIGIKRTDFKKQLAKEYRSSWAAHQQQGFLSFYFLPRKKPTTCAMLTWLPAYYLRQATAETESPCHCRCILFPENSSFRLAQLLVAGRGLLLIIHPPPSSLSLLI